MSVAITVKYYLFQIGTSDFLHSSCVIVCFLLSLRHKYVYIYKGVLQNSSLTWSLTYPSHPQTPLYKGFSEENVRDEGFLHDRKVTKIISATLVMVSRYYFLKCTKSTVIVWGYLTRPTWCRPSSSLP